MLRKVAVVLVLILVVGFLYTVVYTLVGGKFMVFTCLYCANCCVLLSKIHGKVEQTTTCSTTNKDEQNWLLKDKSIATGWR